MSSRFSHGKYTKISSLFSSVFISLCSTGSINGGRIAPLRSTSALVLSSTNSNREKIYVQQPPISASGYSSQAINPHFAHTVRKTETRVCSDCHLSEEKDNNITILKERKIKNLNEIGIKEGSELLELGKRLENLLIKLKEKSKEIINENTKSGLIEKQKLESELEKLKIEYKELQVIDEKIRQLEVSIPTITTKLDMVEKNLKQKELEKFNVSTEKYFEGKDNDGNLLRDKKGKELKNKIDKYIHSFFSETDSTDITVTDGSLKKIL